MTSYFDTVPYFQLSHPSLWTQIFLYFQSNCLFIVLHLSSLRIEDFLVHQFPWALIDSSTLKTIMTMIKLILASCLYPDNQHKFHICHYPFEQIEVEVMIFQINVGLQKFGVMLGFTSSGVGRGIRRENRSVTQMTRYLDPLKVRIQSWELRVQYSRLMLRKTFQVNSILHAKVTCRSHL